MTKSNQIKNTLVLIIWILKTIFVKMKTYPYIYIMCTNVRMFPYEKSYKGIMLLIFTQNR